MTKSATDWRRLTTRLYELAVMEIKKIDHEAPALAAKIFQLRQICYKQEANLIGVEDFPPLRKSAAEIAADPGDHYGLFEGDELAGALHFESPNISSLLVHPSFQRRGVATRLVTHILETATVPRVTVSTAEKNTAATSLYQALGFTARAFREVDGIRIVNFEIQLDPGAASPAGEPKTPSRTLRS